MLKRIFFITLLSCIILGCENELNKPILFNAPIKGRLVNLAKKEGNAIKLSDSLSIHFKFNPTNKHNTILVFQTKSKIEIPIFKGTVTKRNEFYILNKKLDNGYYYLRPIQITKDSITGIFDDLFIQSWNLRKLIDQEQYAHLIQDTVDNILLKVSKKEGKQLMRELLKSQTSLKIER